MAKVEATRNEPPGAPKVKTKRKKTYVEYKETALDLALSVANASEQKITDRKDAQHQRQELLAKKPSDRKHRPSSREKLKQVKSAIVAERARAKKEKAKQQKDIHKAPQASGSGRGSSAPHDDTSYERKPIEKRVSFA